MWTFLRVKPNDYVCLFFCSGGGEVVAISRKILSTFWQKLAETRVGKMNTTGNVYQG